MYKMLKGDADMGRPLFTPEELEELRKFDEIVDASPMTKEDYETSYFVSDLLFGFGEKQRKKAERIKSGSYEKERQRVKAYAEKNKEKIKARRAAYYQKNKAAIAAKQKDYRARKKSENGRTNYEAQKAAFESLLAPAAEPAVA